ncbi:uncharacterized protein DUF4199 [Chitinophaga skermanii]|uniref:Uncharacterized protein DUF4199 n=1 Tax=Chitinophaga skermanii TaxID=331697 RepID=A0A327QUC1_9BACT|nr:DUF4199 family protein [Chitinophaga skermanii]RAJ05347.1 uncharacterized protein DUF4199 [Chitinophaga skermanii]
MKSKVHIKFGLGAALVAAILFSIFYFLESQENAGAFKWAFILVMAGGIFMSCMQYVKVNGKATFGELFSNGFRTTAVIIVIFLAFVMACVTLSPTLKTKIMNEAAQANASTPATTEMSDDALKEQQEHVSAQFIPFLLAGALLPMLIIGGVSSALAAMVTKNSNISSSKK